MKKKDKGISGYGKPFKGRCIKCRKYGYKLTDLKCPENKKKHGMTEYEKKIAEEKSIEVLNVRKKERK